MGYALNNITAPDNYGPDSTLYCRDGARLNLDVANGAIFFQVGVGGGDPVWDSTEYFMTPSFRSLDRAVDAVRIKAAVPASRLTGPQAQVTVHVITSPELGA